MNNDVFYTGPSVEFLRRKCQKIFRSYFSTGPMFIGGKNFSWNDGRDVILMGDALLLLTNSYLWPKNGEFKLWVLSESHKALLVNDFGLKKNEISVIPRKLILPEKKVIRPWPDLQRPSTLVLSSRFDKEKNIPLTLHLASELQGIYPRLRIAIFTPSNKKKEYTKLVNEFSWKAKPTYYGDRGFNWHHTPLKNPFLVNLSTYPMEDFGVSVAQARSKGWPVILSDWGAFEDVSKKSHLKINVNLIHEYNSLRSRTLKNAFVRSLALKLDFDSSDTDEKKPLLDLSSPKPIKASRLALLQNQWTSELRKKLLSELGV